MSSSAAASPDYSSVASTASADKSSSDAVAHSARALNANSSRSLVGVVESIIRPMLTPLTASSERQQIVRHPPDHC